MVYGEVIAPPPKLRAIYGIYIPPYAVRMRYVCGMVREVCVGDWWCWFFVDGWLIIYKKYIQT